MEVIMRYEIPVCDIVKLNDEDIISTSFYGEEGGEPGDTSIMPIANNTDNG